jgi:hypothetical protein
MNWKRANQHRHTVFSRSETSCTAMSHQARVVVHIHQYGSERSSSTKKNKPDRPQGRKKTPPKKKSPAKRKREPCKTSACTQKRTLNSEYCNRCRCTAKARCANPKGTGRGSGRGRYLYCAIHTQ